jgi:hypothetical protein
MQKKVLLVNEVFHINDQKSSLKTGSPFVKVGAAIDSPFFLLILVDSDIMLRKI